jgi:hypothetical protein
MLGIIANEIIGVSTGSMMSILRYNESLKMNNMKYKTFLRLNNRTSKQTREDFYRAGYLYVDADWSKDWRGLYRWCRENIGKERYVWFGKRFFFENEDDKIMFILAGWAA